MFRIILTTIQGKKTNIVDNMMKMLEDYSNNLEGIVKSRTAELEVEKQKSQELLSRYLASPLLFSGGILP